MKAISSKSVTKGGALLELVCTMYTYQVGDIVQSLAVYLVHNIMTWPFICSSSCIVNTHPECVLGK